MKLVLDKFPGFQNAWQVHVEWWEGEEAGFCNDMSAFSIYTRDLIKHGKSHEEVKNIFDFIEELVVSGTEEVQTVATTCFLENLINAVDWGRIPASSFVHLLGKESREYCKAWDKFTGVETEGL